jgi:transcriptional regulator with AAA-type ATPase domain/tetratricopeptide (TPR) repeat protein
MHQLLGASPALAAVRDELTRLLARSAPRRLPPVLIQGETGTGKGLVAHLVHQMGPRAGASFVDVNCAAIPETMLEAELFGFERGAFTDARQAKPGLLQIAHRGTIFLDEIGLMPDALQAKLLKALEDHSVRRLGGTRTEPADAWVVAATSEPLAEAIQARRFREDLYHRIAVVTVQLPPLRERGGDVLLLARHYLDRACSEYGLAPKTLTSDAEKALLAYPWPGNVRELANVMERVALLSDSGEITASAMRLPQTPRPIAPHPRSSPGVDEQMASLERAQIEEALRMEGWNISRSAARLGLARNTLRYRMERHGLSEAGDSAKRRRKPESSSERPDADARSGSPGSSPSVRWQQTRVTLLQARVLDAGEGVAEHELAPVVDTLAEKATGFGGRILDMTGGVVQAAFGLDVVEDAACLAARAALAMRSAVSAQRSSLARITPVRIALHTDEILVGRLDGRIELDADGRRAAQGVLDALHGEAASEGIVASASTKPFIDRRFSLEPLTPGVGDRRSWRVVGIADTERHATPFVSRVRDLALLDDLLAQVEEGRGQAVLLAGEPGIGKSRLLQEFRVRIGARAAWLQGSAVSFGGSLPLHPLIDLLKHACGIHADDSDHIVISRIDDATAAFGDAFRASMPFLRSLLLADIGETALSQLDPKLRRAGIFDAARHFLHLTSRSRPLVVVLEDLHWMDQATGEFLGMLTDGLASDRILLCATHRSGYSLPLAPGAFGTRLTLSGVSTADTGAIGRSLLGAAELSPELRHLVETKTDGNPFFVEELIRTLSERDLLARRGDEVGLSGPAEIDLPATVQDVIRGRLDRLDPGARDLLHVAAVIGREFPRGVLESVMGGTLPSIDDRIQSLRSAELIQHARNWPDVVYMFKHALTHEVAYHAQPEARRREQHARIGEAIEAAYADRLSEHSGVLAHHFSQAERWDKALTYLLAAAQQAERTFATREALALYDEALRATESRSGGVGDPSTLIAIHDAKARLYFVMSDFGRSVAEGERILPLARLIDDRVKEAEALATIGWAWMWQRDLDAAIRFSREALAVAEPYGPLAVQGRAYYTIGFVRAVTGVHDESHVALDKAMAISTGTGDAVYRSLSLAATGLLRNWTGEYDEAERLQGEALGIAREQGLLYPLLFTSFLRGLTLTGKGDYDEALQLFTEGLSLSERAGDEAVHHRLLNCLGWLYADLGDLDRAEQLNATSARFGRRRTDVGAQPNAELNLAEIFRARGELARAADQYDEVFRYWKNPPSHWMRFRYAIRMFAGMGDVALARGDHATARSHAAQCFELATRTRSRKNLIKASRLLADIAHAERDWASAERHFQTAIDLATAVGNPVQRWKTELAVGRFLQEAGRPEEAHAAFKRALAVMQQVRDGLRDERLRGAFEKNADLQALRRLVSHV